MTNLWNSNSNLIQLGVLNGQYQRYVYRYRPLNNFTDEIFKKSELWFASPKTFNDPFDCQIISKTNNSIQEIKDFISENDKTISNNQSNSLAKEWYDKPSELHIIVNRAIKKIFNESGVCCFAGSNDNILMWSHYTVSHKGICMTFDLIADPNLFIIPLKVVYDDNYPHYNHLRDNSTILNLFQTKAKCWSYENEFRVFKPSFGNYLFDKKSLTEICFGVNTSDDDIQKVKVLLKTYGFNDVRLKMAKISTSAFQLKIVDL